MFRKQYVNFKEIDYIKKILFILLGIDVPAWIDYGVNSKDKLTKAQRKELYEISKLYFKDYSIIITLWNYILFYDSFKFNFSIY